MAGPRIFVVDRRVVVASGRGADDATERFCHAAIRRLNANQPEEIAWECAASADRGHFAAIFRKTKDGEVVTRRYSHAQAEAATEAVRLGWAEAQDPAAVAAYEARTLEGATGAKEITLPSPEGRCRERRDHGGTRSRTRAGRCSTPTRTAGCTLPADRTA